MTKGIRCEDDKTRSLCRKALKAIGDIFKKYPEGESDTSFSNEESRAYFQQTMQHIRECVKECNFSTNPAQIWNWWERLRVLRNASGHQVEDFTPTEFREYAKTCFEILPKIKQDLESAIKLSESKNPIKRFFEKFASFVFGSKNEKSQLVDAMENMVNPAGPEELEIEVPDNKYAKLAEATLSEALVHEDVSDYAQSHHGVGENIQTDILEWIQKIHDDVSMQDPFIEEAEFIRNVKETSAIEIATTISKVEHNYKRVPSVSPSKRGCIVESNVNFGFYEKEFSKLDFEKGKKGKVQAEILHRNLVKDMEQSLVDRKNKWEQDQIEASRKRFLEDLFKKIQNFKKLESLLSPFIKDLGRLWDLSTGVFQTSGFEILQSFADLLKDDESLKELAEVLGKQSREQSSFDKELRDKTVIKPCWKSQPAYSGAVVGITYSNKVSSALPNELALLRNPAAKKLFQLKFAQKQLLSHRYESQIAGQNVTHEQETVMVEKKEPKGPIIVCVDTSGSMHGAPERIAKTITFALSKIAIQEKRKCYLISFSTGIETLDLSDFTSVDPIQKLVGFLRMSFNGGTDAEPALHHSLKLLSENDWKNADVLMISDFVMPGLNDDVRGLIEAEKERNTCFYSLVIGSSGNRNTIESFNHNWAYDTADPHAQRHLVQQLHELKMRKNVT